MAFVTPPNADSLARSRAANGAIGDSATTGSAVSWGAVVAGAAAAAALSLILLMLGVGLGLSSVSPWVRDGISAATLGVSTIVWVTLTQLIASAMGGYLAGRLRTKWTAVHRDEVYFRDTAHGFLAWAVASLATAALLTSVIGSIVSGGVATTAALPQDADRVAAGGPIAYFIDSLFRRDTDAASAAAAGLRPTALDTEEVNHIFMNVSRNEPLPAEDVRYVAQLVAPRTGLSQQDAEKRVADVYAKAQAKLRGAELATREAADRARKASAYSALWLFVSLLGGAFAASLAATFGGRSRDA